MNGHHRVRLQDTAAQPWRNGGGVTHELLAWPASGAWQVRVSVATIDRSGPFSAFPGVCRAFAVLTGAGVRLGLPDGWRTLAPGDAPLHFDGEAAPDCHLIDGPTRDLNLMTQREHGRATMTPAGPGSSSGPGARWRGLYAADDVMVEIEGQAEPVPGGSLLWTDDPLTAAWTLHPAAGGRAWWLALET